MSDLLNRRELMIKSAPILAAAGVMATVGSAWGQTSGDTKMAAPMPGFKDGAYVLPPLSYAYEALEPHIDAETVHLHHDKHHKAYVDGLNKALAELTKLDAAPEANAPLLVGLQEDLSFNAAGHLLHTLFWSSMGPNAGGEPTGALADAIKKDFGSIAAFRTRFSRVAASVKGSGWAILAHEPVGDRLIIIQVKQHDLQIVPGATPLLPLDVWEHAYYLKYKNVRADYVKAWWNVVNWSAVSEVLTTSQKHGGM